MTVNRRVLISAAVVAAMPLLFTGCSHNSKSSVSDDQYAKMWGKKGDLPPAGFSDYMKTHGPNAVTPNPVASNK